MTTDSPPDDDGAASAPAGGVTFRLRSAWLLTSSTTLTIGLVAFAVSPIVSRLLGADGRGRLVTIQLIPQLLADLAAVGTGFAIIHFGARHPRAIGSFISWSSRIAVVGSLVMFGIGQLIAPLVTDVASDERLFRCYLLICPLTAFIVIANESQRAVGDFRRWNLFTFLRGLTWPVSTLAGVLLAEDPFTLIVGLHLLLTVVLLVVLWADVRRRLGGRRAAVDVERGTFTRYGVASAASTVPRTANAKLDQVAMTFVVGKQDLGLYAAAVGWGALTVPVMRGLTGISMPHVSSASTEQRTSRVRQLVTLGVVVTLVVGTVGALATFVLWVPLYGSDFESARTAAMVMIPASLLLELNAVLSNVLRSLDRPNLVALLEVGVLVVSTAMLLIVLTQSQVLGPALLSLATYFIACLAYAWFIARSLGVRVLNLVSVDVLRSLRGG